MESVSVPLRTGGKKMRKRRELDALVEHSLAKRYFTPTVDPLLPTMHILILGSFCIHRACNSTKRQVAGNGINSQDQLLSHSTDDQEDYFWVNSVFYGPDFVGKVESFVNFCFLFPQFSFHAKKRKTMKNSLKYE